MNAYEAKVLAQRMLKEHNLNDWNVVINQMNGFAGKCSYSNLTIYLSGHQTENRSVEYVKNTILHEIAHALVGPNHGHDKVWVAKALEIGCNGLPSCQAIEFGTDDSKVTGMSFCDVCKHKGLITSEITSTLVRLDCGHLSKKQEQVKVDESWTLVSSDGKFPRQYQYDGISFVQKAGFRALIADEMGLGKTIQYLGVLAKAKEEILPALIVVKASLKVQTLVETIRWAGLVPQLIDNSKDVIIPDLFKVYIVSYDLLRRFSKPKKVKIKTEWGMEIEKEIKESPFYEFPFKTIVLDECQAIKNDGSARYEEIENICKGKDYVIGVSGTPIKNHAIEYFPILNILRPDLFPYKEGYIRDWVDSWEDENGYTKYGGIKPYKLEEWKALTQEFIIRRSRLEVAPEIPTINRIFFHVGNDNKSLQKMYASAEDDFVKGMLEKSKVTSIDILGMIAQMRHIVGLMKVHPTVDRAIEFLENTDDKQVIFIHHKDVAEAISVLIGKYLVDNGFKPPLQFHSGLDANQRYEMIMDFMRPENRVLVASSLAAGEGINLQFCHRCIIAERQWNPANEEQMEARFLRIGQKSDKVEAEYVVATDTIDEYFTELVEKKRSYMNATLDGKISNYHEEGLMKELSEILISKNRKRVFKW